MSSVLESVSASNSSPCWPVSRAVAGTPALGVPDADPSPLITATTTSGPGPAIPGDIPRCAPGCTLRTVGRRRQPVNDPIRRVAEDRLCPGLTGLARRSGGPAEVLRGNRVQELAELLDLVLLLVGDGHARLVQDLVAGEDGGA